MRTHPRWILLSTLLVCRALDADDLSSPVSLDARWWNEHELGWRLAESAGLRWAIVDGISARGRVGGENLPAAKHAEEYEKQTGIRIETINGILVLHRPDEPRRKELEAKLSSGGQAAWLLGWLKDARAWPALAKAAAAKDPDLALPAAHALRRLDGEENFDLRRWVVGSAFYEKAPDGGLSQAPLGACFKDPIAAGELEALAASPWVPLREAAARIAPGCGAAGRRAAERLSNDPSLLVRQAAARALRAWQAPPEAVRRPVHKPDLAAHWTAFQTKGEDGARKSGPWLAAFGGEEDLRKLVTYTEIENPHVRAAALSAVTHYAGGPAAAELFRKVSSQGKPWPDDNHTWGRTNPISMGKYGLAMLFDGEALAKELGPRLGTENWALSSEFLLARFAGPPALPALEKAFPKRGFAATVAAGYVGGPGTAARLGPALASDDLGTAVWAARGLGESAQPSAVGPLIGALGSPHRVVRSRAALALGRIGGPEAARALAARARSEREYLPRRSAVEALKEIGEAAPGAEKELAEFVPAYAPANPRFGPDFPAGKWVPLGRVHTVASVGETRCAADSFSGLWLRYGGCSGCYSNECVAFDPASEKWFVVRPPENMGLFFNETRAAQGCSRGMAFDPKSRRFFINHAVGGNGSPSNGAMVPSQQACSYDAPLDRFEGNFPDRRRSGGEGPTWYVADSTRGAVLTEWMGPTTVALDTATSKLVDVTFEGAPDLPQNYNHDPVAYDPVSGLLLRFVIGGKYAGKPDLEGLWLFDPAGGKARKSGAGHPEGKHGGGNCMVYDSLNREVLLFLSSGMWRYDREKDVWEKVAGEGAQVYVADFDPQHNVFLALIQGGLSAYRFKSVPAGTKAFTGAK